MKSLFKSLLVILLLGIASIDCCAQMLMSERRKTSDSIANVALKLWQQKNYEESIAVTRKLCDLYADLQGGNNMYYADFLHLLALRQKALRQYAEARENAEKSLGIFEAILPMPTVQDIAVARLCEQCCSAMGDRTMAAEYSEKVLAKEDKIRVPQDSVYAQDVCQLGMNYFYCHEYARAIEAFSRFMSVIAKSDDFFGYDEENIADIFFCWGRCSFELENMDDAMRYISFADTIYMSNEETMKYTVMSKNFLGLLYSRVDPEKALTYYDQAEEVYFDHIDEYDGAIKNLILAIWSNKATLYVLNSPQDALGSYNNIIEYYDSGNAEPDGTYAMSLANKAYCLAVAGDSVDVAVANVNRALELLEKLGYTEMQIYLEALVVNGYVAMMTGDENLIEESAKKLNDHITSQLSNNFPTLDEEERAGYWNKVSGWYTSDLPFMTLNTPTPRIVELCYNALLQSKGLLLNATVNIDRLLKESDNPDLQGLREQWAQSKERLQKAVADGNERERRSAQTTARALEKRILKSVAAYGNFMSDLNICAADVRRALSDDALAVEFLAVPGADDTDTTYVALTLKRDYEVPHIVTLGSSAQLNALARSKTYGGLAAELYDFVWRPIIDDAGSWPRTLYFSADGLIYNLPIEYCATTDGRIVMEACRCYRVSSTREIVKQQADTTAAVKDIEPAAKDNERIVIYGDIDYNAGLSAMALADAETRSMYGEADWPTENLLASRSIDDERGGARRVIRLDGARPEINSIVEVLEHSGAQPVVFDSCRATKASIKMIAGSDLRLLHIVTHGVYVSPQNRSAYHWLLRPVTDAVEDDDNGISSEDEMLSRSALVMAGINVYVAQGNGQSEALLTARDISLLNLSGLDLAVLSACETARGDVSGEGVFGLQRGFKKAGTKSLLMSLMKVNDHATMLFMQHFYEQLVKSGGNKYDALLEAIRYVRNAENGRWNSPQFWASFILLDGQN